MCRAGFLRFLDANEPGKRDASPTRGHRDAGIAEPGRAPPKKRARDDYGDDDDDGDDDDAPTRTPPRDPSARPRGARTPPELREKAARAVETPRRTPDPDEAARAVVSSARQHSCAANTAVRDVDAAPPAEEEEDEEEEDDPAAGPSSLPDDSLRDARSMTSGLRRWAAELRALRAKVAEEAALCGGDDHRARDRTGASLLDGHLRKADAVMDALAVRREALAREAEALGGIGSLGSSSVSGGASRMDRAGRRLQLFDAEAFALLCDVASMRTRKLFDPLGDVSAGMVTRYLRAKFKARGEAARGVNGDFKRVGVDFADVGASLAACARIRAVTTIRGVEGAAVRALAGADEHLGDDPETYAPMDPIDIRRLRRRGASARGGFIDPAAAAAGSTGGFLRASNRRAALAPLRRPERLRDVGADAADSSSDDDDDGVGGRGGVPRGAGGGADDDGLRAARERRRADRDANRRARALERVLRRSGAKGRGMTLGACVFDPTSFSRSVEKVLDVATLVAAGRAAVGAAAEEDDAREEDVGGASAKDGARASDERFLKNPLDRFVVEASRETAAARRVGGTLGRAKVRRRVARAEEKAAEDPERSRSDPVRSASSSDGDVYDDDETVGISDAEHDNAAFVLHLDLASWRAMGGGGPDGRAEPEDAAHAVGEDGAPANASPGDGARRRAAEMVVMPASADPYEALLEDDELRARAALDALSLSDRDRATCAGIAYAYREAFLSESFFRAWSADVLVSFYHFSVAAPGGAARELATRAARRVAARWLEMHEAGVPEGAGSEDVLFYNEGCHALERLGFECDALKAQVRQHAARFASRDFLRVDCRKPETYAWTAAARDATFKRRAAASKGGGRRRATTKAREKESGFFLSDAADCRKLSTALIWSYFLEATGVERETLPNGDAAVNVRVLCEDAVDLSAINATYAEDQRAAPDFEAVCYFVTHKIFTRTDWCKRKLRAEDWAEERRFLLDHLEFVTTRMRGGESGGGDVHLAGEFVQTLRCLRSADEDEDEEKQRRVCDDAVAFILKAQDPASGGWEVRDHDLKNSYHATVCAVGALLTPMMDGVREKETREDCRRARKAREDAARDADETTDAPTESARVASLRRGGFRRERAARTLKPAAETRPWERAAARTTTRASAPGGGGGGARASARRDASGRASPVEGAPEPGTRAGDEDRRVEERDARDGDDASPPPWRARRRRGG
jgi:hypothetical protein